MRTDRARSLAGVLFSIVAALAPGLPAAASSWDGVWEGGLEQRIVVGEFDEGRTNVSPLAATGSVGILRCLGRGWSLGPVARGSWGPDIERVGIGLRLDRRLGQEWNASIAPGLLLHRDDSWFDVSRGNFYGVVRFSFRDALSFEYRNEMVQYQPRYWADFRTTPPPERTLHDSYLGISTAQPPGRFLVAGGAFALFWFHVVDWLHER
jgi:hypothetical protein